MISIIVPVYNASRYIEDCIRSVLSQSFTDWQLILVDDGSTDNSAELINNYLSDPRLKYIYKSNSGVTETRWQGLSKADGDLIMFLDADDMLAPCALDIVNDCFDNSIDILVFKMQSVVKSNQVMDVNDDYVCENIPGDRIIQLDMILSGKILSCVCGGAYRHSIISDCKDIFCNRLRIGEDTMFNLELATKKPLRIRTVSAELYAYRCNPESVTRSVNPAKFDAVKDAIDYLDKYALRNPDISSRLSGSKAFRKLLLWSTFMFHPENEYYMDKNIRRDMRRLYSKAFTRLYSYLRVYLFVDLFLSSWLSQKLINRQ